MYQVRGSAETVVKNNTCDVVTHIPSVTCGRVGANTNALSKVQFDICSRGSIARNSNRSAF